MSTMTPQQVDPNALATGDPKVSRELARAQAQAMAVQQRTAEEDAAAERRMRTAHARLELERQREAHADERRERRQQQRARQREQRRAKHVQTAQRLRARQQAVVGQVRQNAAAVYSSLIYGLAVGGAVYGQITAAIGHGLPAPVGIVAAVAIEGTGLSMATTAMRLRLAGERALAPRLLMWVATGVAVAINLWGHYGWTGRMLAALSAIGITVYEIRSAAKHRTELRERGMLPQPPERFGWRRWVAAPGPTWQAWRLDARERVTPGAAELIARAAEANAQRAAHRATQQAEQRAERERAQTRRQVADAARRAADRAARKGNAGAALAVLMRLAHDGLPPQQPQLPAAQPLDPDTRRLLDLVKRQAVDARTKLVGSVPDDLRRRPYTPAHPRPATAPRPAPEPGPAPAPPPASPEPALRPARPEPGAGRLAAKPRRSVAATVAAAKQRVTVRADDDALATAYRELCKELNRPPSGTELAARAGTSKSSANRWKQHNKKEA